MAMLTFYELAMLKVAGRDVLAQDQQWRKGKKPYKFLGLVDYSS